MAIASVVQDISLEQQQWRIERELAQVRTGETQPGVEPIPKAIRDVIQHCIYGVVLNPLAVDWYKVALWSEKFNRGKPLSFLAHLNNLEE